MRTRLAVTFTAVFLAASAALLALTISLASRSISQANGSDAPAERALQDAIHNILGSSASAASSSSPSLAGSQGDASKAAIGEADAATKLKLLVANRTYSAAAGAAAVDQIITWSLVAAAGLVPVTALLGWVLAGRALRPVRQVTAAAQRVSDNRLSERLNLPGPRDEITELAATFDAMMSRLETAFDAQRRFIANASHELRTPLAVAGTAVDVVLAKPAHTSRQLEEMALDVRSALTRAEEVIDSLLALTRSRHLDRRREPVDLATLADDALDAHQDALAARAITVDATLEEALLIGDGPLLERLVHNLVDNAVRHNLPGGRVTAYTGARDRHVEFVIANTGARIPPEAVASLFEPFVRLAGRAHTADAGLGLGLAIARAVADAHDAELTAVALPEGGLQVALRLSREPTTSAGPGTNSRASCMQRTPDR